MLIGESAKEKEELGQETTVKFKELVQLMVRANLKRIEEHGDI